MYQVTVWTCEPNELPKVSKGLFKTYQAAKEAYKLTTHTFDLHCPPPYRMKPEESFSIEDWKRYPMVKVERLKE
jgi:hypothetical protein